MSAVSIAARKAIPDVLLKMFSRRNRFITVVALLAALVDIERQVRGETAK